MLQPAAEQTEVIAGGGEDAIDVVAVLTLEVVTAHAVFGLEVSDHRLDGGASAHFFCDCWGDAAHIAGDPDTKAIGTIVAPVTLGDVDAPRLDAGYRLHIIDGGAPTKDNCCL